MRENITSAECGKRNQMLSVLIFSVLLTYASSRSCVFVCVYNQLSSALHHQDYVSLALLVN